MSIRGFQRTKFGTVMAPIAVIVTGWASAQAILDSRYYYLLAPLVVVTTLLVVRQILKDWRTGILCFLAWMSFEDLVRKYMGNNMAIYFAKDALLAVCCLSFYATRGSKRFFQTTPKFVLPLIFFFFWSLLEAFNPNSPSIWYGMLGLKLYFGYVPLFFLGYALLKNESDLRRFLSFNMIIAVIISLIAVAQGVTGKVLLAPDELAPDIRELGSLVRTAPITGETFLRTPSVFVSDGRFGGYVLLAFLLGLGATTYFFLRSLRTRKWLIVAMVLIMAGILISGVRSALMWAIISFAVFILAFVPEMQLKSATRRQITTAVSATAILATLAFVFLSFYYPDALSSRVAFYGQTLLPSSSAFELVNRFWDYPTTELLKAFSYPSWPLGYGTGTCSVGTQYVARIFGASRTNVGVESGYGNLILEMGIPGLLLWLIWTSVLLVAEWKVVRQLRRTALFPLGFVIFWFTFITLVPGMISGNGLENYITSAYLFLLAGILFGLPALIQADSRVPTPIRRDEKAVPAIPRRPVGSSLPLAN
jgi:hypothetical protein